MTQLYLLTVITSLLTASDEGDGMIIVGFSPRVADASQICRGGGVAQDPILQGTVPPPGFWVK